MAPFFHKLGGKVKWVRFEGSSHLPHLEEPEEFLKVVGEWLGEFKMGERQGGRNGRE